MIAQFSRLKSDELKALQPLLSVFLFPVGGLEQHGPHLPMGLKLIQAEVTARLIAEKLEQRMPLWNFILTYFKSFKFRAFHYFNWNCIMAIMSNINI